MQFTVIFYCKIAIFYPSPEKFRACGARFGGRCAPGPAAPDPPSIEHPRQPLHLVAYPGLRTDLFATDSNFINTHDS